MRRLCCALVLFANVVAAQPVVIGTIESEISGVFPGSGPQTFIDLSHPANRNGNVSTVSLVWNTVPTPAACTAALKIKFFRRGAGTFALVAERGPFPVQGGYFTVALTPPVTVQKDDLLGVVQLLNSATCGTVTVAQVSPRETLLRNISSEAKCRRLGDPGGRHVGRRLRVALPHRSAARELDHAAHTREARLPPGRSRRGARRSFARL
jgi:hypothetical protein